MVEPSVAELPGERKECVALSAGIGGDKHSEHFPSLEFSDKVYVVGMIALFKGFNPENKFLESLFTCLIRRIVKRVVHNSVQSPPTDF